MAIYRVQAPDGSIVRIEGPDNATQEQLAQAVSAYAKAASVPAAQANATPPSMVDQIPGPNSPGQKGMLEAGNIDLNNRPRVRNADGSISTVRSMSVNIDGKEVLIPTVSDDGRILSEDEAIQAYLKTGRHLGKFTNPADATKYAEQLHEAQAKQYVTQPNAKGPSLVDNVVGVGETALNLLTGGTSGLLGAVGGALGGIAGAIASGEFGTQQGVRNVEQTAVEGMQKLTYEPKTQAGQEMAGAVGEVMQQLVPVAPLTAEMAAVARGAAPAVAATRDVARAAPTVAKQAARTTSDSVKKAVDAVFSKEPTQKQPTPGTMGSVGSAGTDMATQRRELAADLPVPIELTKGQAERSFEQLRFEKETAKDPSVGAPLRTRFDDQNEAILRNFDAWLDQTGAQAPDLVATGRIVDRALAQRAKRDKAEINVAYKNAEKAGEMAEPVPMEQVVAYLNESASAESVAPILSAARRELVRLGGAELDANGNLVPREMSLNNAEFLRKFINRATGEEKTNQLYAGELKGVIDASTEGLGGDLYKRARGLRQRYAERYENRAIVSQLMNTKRGTQDRRVAFEDVFEKTMLNGSQEDIRFLRRVLQTGGDDGQQAWRELQGATINWLREEATKNVATDQRGNRIVSAAGLDRALKRLDHDGKLEFIFGKKGAQQLRDINDLTKLVYTAPPGAVNTSNTASVLIAALTEAGVTGSMTGLPVPVLTGLRLLSIRVKDKRIQKRVEEALREATRNAEPTSGEASIPTNRTLH